MLTAHFDHAKLAVQQMAGWIEFRTVYAPAIDPEAFGELREAAKYLLSVGEGSVIPGELAKKADLPVAEILPYDMLSGDEFRNLLKELYAEDFKFDRKNQTTTDKLRNLAKRNKALSDMLSGKNDAFEALSEIQERFTAEGRIGDPTPFPLLEKYIYGWERKRVYTVGAYSNVGKSKFFYSICSNAMKQGKRCLFVSLEVESGIVLANIASSYLRKPYLEVLKDGNCHQSLPKDMIRIVDDKYDFSAISEEVRKAGADYVFLDFVQNVRNGSGSEYEVMSKTAVDLQEMAKANNVTLFVVSQVPNDSRFKDGENVTLKGSGALFSSSDCILMLTKDGDNLYMTLAKNKVGPAMRKFLLNADFNRGQVECSREVTVDFNSSNS